MAVQPVFLSPLMDQLAGFGKVTALQMFQRLFSSYGAIDKINLEENEVKIMGPYNPVEPLSCIVNQLKKGRDFAIAWGHMISNAMMLSKWIILLVQIATFN